MAEFCFEINRAPSHHMLMPGIKQKSSCTSNLLYSIGNDSFVTLKICAAADIGKFHLCGTIASVV